MEVLKKLNSYESTRNIPVLALSAAATQRDIKKGMEAGFLRYLTKPIQIPVVVDAIKGALTPSQNRPR
jgi:CheY-like chemotaxis protein